MYISSPPRAITYDFRTFPEPCSWGRFYDWLKKRLQRFVSSALGFHWWFSPSIFRFCVLPWISKIKCTTWSATYQIENAARMQAWSSRRSCMFPPLLCDQVWSLLGNHVDLLSLLPLGYSSTMMSCSWKEWICCSTNSKILLIQNKNPHPFKP